MLYISKQNSLAQNQYSLNPLKSIMPSSYDLSSLKSDEFEFEFWSIKLENDFVPENILIMLNSFFVGWKRYDCSSGSYVLSPKLATVIKPEGWGENEIQGVMIIIVFKDARNKLYYLLVADNKTHIQNVQGGLEIGEDVISGIKREVREETRINLDSYDLVEVGSYKFLGGNELINCRWVCQNLMFCVFLPWTDVCHLFPQGVHDMEVTKVNVADLEFCLDETLQIFAIPIGTIDSVPEFFTEFPRIRNEFGEKKSVPLEFELDSHHRQFVEKFRTDLPIKSPFLLECCFQKRWGHALSIWNKKNKVIF